MHDHIWQEIFHDRMHRFSNIVSHDANSTAFSIKIRASTGCYHREHSPQAYDLIDKYLQSGIYDGSFQLEAHESGPEILAFVAGAGFSAGVIGLVVAILNARSSGVRDGDRPNAPLEIIVRGYHKGEEYVEEILYHFNSTDIVTSEMIETILNGAVMKQEKMGEQKQNIYNFNHSVGNVAIDSHNFEQSATVNQSFQQANINLAELTVELPQLREALILEANEPQHYDAISAIQQAEIAAKEDDGPKAMGLLSKVGTWTFDIATKIGTTVAAEAIKRAIGIGH